MGKLIRLFSQFYKVFLLFKKNIYTESFPVKADKFYHRFKTTREFTTTTRDHFRCFSSGCCCCYLLPTRNWLRLNSKDQFVQNLLTARDREANESNVIIVRIEISFQFTVQEAMTKGIFLTGRTRNMP